MDDRGEGFSGSAIKQSGGGGNGGRGAGVPASPALIQVGHDSHLGMTVATKRYSKRLLWELLCKRTRAHTMA